MSLRLILEIAAREINPDETSDKVYKSFVGKAVKDIPLKKPEINYFSLTESEFSKNLTFEGLLGKFAHGNVIVTQNDVLECSKLVGKIIKHYFGK